MIDLWPMKEIHVDPRAAIAWVQPGVLWGELDAATQEHGLAVTGGRVVVAPASPASRSARAAAGSSARWAWRPTTCAPRACSPPTAAW